MGSRQIPYWLGTFLFDFLVISILNILQIIAFSNLYNSLDPDIFEGKIINKASFIKVSIPYVFSIVTAAYMWSNIFKKSLTSVKVYPLFYTMVLYLVFFFVSRRVWLKYRLVDGDNAW